MSASPAPAPAAIDHYENFPVASWLCPPRLRAPIAAIYHFARTADDVADEGDAPVSERLATLQALHADLLAVAHARAPSPRWPQVFAPLAVQWRNFELPLAPFEDLLSAFEQDVRKSAAAGTYADRAELLDYCRRSANPVGRLLLHLYGVTEPAALAESDAVCTALQLINFWQDLSIDLPRGRHYLPLADCAAHGIAIDPVQPQRALPVDQKTTELIASLADWTRAGMQNSSKLVHRVPGRGGWELRAVVQGALRVLDKVDALGAEVLRQRPRLTRADAPRVLWRMLRM